MSFVSSPVTRLRAARPAPPRLRAAFLLALAALIVGTSLKYAAKAARPGDTGLQSRSAFLRWRGMINDLFAGTNVYVGAHEYPNPPVMAIILRPFAALPPMAGALEVAELKADQIRSCGADPAAKARGAQPLGVSVEPAA